MYENFDIHISVATDSGYSLSVIDSPAGETDQVTWQPLPEEDPDFSDYITYLRNLIAKPEDVKALGQILQRFLFPEAIQSLYKRSLEKVRTEGKRGLRVRLRISSDLARLHQIPWEYCYDGKQFPALNTTTPLVRYPPTAESAASLAKAETMRILMVMAANPEKYPSLDVQAEEEWIRRALSDLEQKELVSLKVVGQAGLDTLSSAVVEFRPHILHFNGHGDLKKNGEGALVLQDAQGEAQLAGAEDMMVLLRDRGVGLVILSACQTAVTGSADALMGVAPGLVSAGLPAVIGMQFDVPDETAERFMQVLYTHLAARAPLDEAMTEARNRLYFTQEDKVFWGIPVLFMRAPDGLFWQPEAPAVRRGVDYDDKRLKPPKHYITRPQISERLQEQLLHGQGAPAVTLLHGMVASGKTTLAGALAQAVWSDYTDGVLWVTLGQKSEVLNQLVDLIGDLGDKDSLPTTVEGASQKLHSLLAKRRVLLVLDDAWKYKDVEPFLVGGPRCHILVTSRRAGVLGDHRDPPYIYRLRELTESQALDMLAKLLGKTAESPFSEKEREQALALVNSVGRLPLALELTARRIAGGSSWRELIAALKAEIADLRALEPDVLRRLKGNLYLEAQINLSLRWLREEFEPGWKSFVWLGVLPEDAMISAPAAATLWQVSPEDAGEILALLHDENLLLAAPAQQIGKPAYALHDLLHDVARSWLKADTPQGLGLTLLEANVELLRHYKELRTDDLWYTLPADGYIQANLTWHMEQANQIEEIHQLLEEETEDGRNGWYQAQERLGNTADYLVDVTRAWQLAREAGVKTNGQFLWQSTALQIRYLLMLSSLSSLAANIPTPLLIALVEKEQWKPARAITYARRVSYPKQRAEMMIGLLPFTDSARQVEWFREAFAISQSIEHEEDRARALTQLVHSAPDSIREQALKDVLEQVRLFEAGEFQWQVLMATWEEMPGILLEKAISAAQTIRRKGWKNLALLMISQHLAEQERKILLNEISIDFTGGEENVLSETPQLVERVIDAVVDDAKVYSGEIDGREKIVHILTHLLPYLEEENRHQVAKEALNIAEKISSVFDWAKAVAGLAEYIPRAELSDKIGEVREMARPAQEDGFWDFTSPAFVEIARIAPIDLRDEISQEALIAVRAMTSGEGLFGHYGKAEAFIRLAPCLETSVRAAVLNEAVEAAQAIKRPGKKSEVLTGIVLCLDGAYQSKILNEALLAAQEIDDCGSVALALANFCRDLDGPVLDEAEITARNCHDRSSRDMALSHIVLRLAEVGSPERAYRIIQGIESEADKAAVIRAMSAHLPEALLEEALKTLSNMESRTNQALAIAAIADCFPAPRKKELLLEVSENVESYDEVARFYLARFLAGKGYILEAWKTIDKTEDPYDGLLRIVDEIPTTVNKPELAEFLATSEHMFSEHYYALLVTSLPNPLLSQSMVQKARNAARSSRRPAKQRMELLINLLVHLPEDEKEEIAQEVLQGIRAMVETDSTYVEQALSRIVPLLSLPLLREVLEIGRQLDQKIVGWQPLVASRFWELGLKDEALEFARSITFHEVKSRALVNVAQRLCHPSRSEVVAEALDAALLIKHAHVRRKAFMSLQPLLIEEPVLTLSFHFDRILSALSRQNRGDLLADLGILTPTIERLGGKESNEQIFHTIQDVGRWWP